MLSMALQPFSKITTIINVLVDSVLTREAAKLSSSHNGHNVVSVIIVLHHGLYKLFRRGRPELSV